MTMTFDSVSLVKARTINEGFTHRGASRVLLDGRESVKLVPSNYGQEFSLRCYTTSYTDITSIIAKIGVKGSLVLTNTVTNCVLMSVRVNPSPDYTQWEYILTFRRDTT